jgi:hypothetical protein
MLLIGETLTMTEPKWAKAVYLVGNKIADVGSAEDLQARYPGVKRQWVERITPGLHDAHTHPAQWGQSLRALKLFGLTTPKAVADAVAQQSRALSPESWILGTGYVFDHYPTSELLDAVAPHNPVLLSSRDHHSSWANGAALKAAGITSATPDPPSGVIVRDAEGEPTGYLLEAATNLVEAHAPQLSIHDLKAGLTDLARRGYTATHHMGWAPLEWAELLARDNTLPVRLWWALDRGKWQGIKPGWRGDSLNVMAVKFFADGALGSRTAWMVEPYPDGSHGMQLDTIEEIRAEGQAALKAGFGLVIHAIGTRANAEIIGLFAELVPQAGRVAEYPFRLEHVQHLRDSDLSRLKGLPVALSVQPIHAVDDAALVAQHLPGHAHEALRLRDLWNTGLPLAFGSDAPVALPDVVVGIGGAVRHPINLAQSISEEQALWAFTRGAAIAAGWPQHGLVKPGSPADLTLWEGGKPIGRVFGGVLELHQTYKNTL